MVATLPRRLALRSAARGDIAVLALPYRRWRLRTEMIWHERSAADPSIGGCWAKWRHRAGREVTGPVL